jgi:hypothetical protein
MLTKAKVKRVKKAAPRKKPQSKFEMLPIEKKRVRVAKDVLKWIESGVLKAVSSCYFSSNSVWDKQDQLDQEKVELRDLIKDSK